MSLALDWNSEWLTLTTEGGVEHRYPAIWLRDNVPASRHRPNGQRVLDITELAPPTLRYATVESDRVEIDFGDHSTSFDLDFLLQFGTAVADPDHEASLELWNASIELRWHEADALDEPAGLLLWLRDLRHRGFALLRGLPAEPDQVMALAERFGFVRETNYGRFYDVITEPDPANLANGGGRLKMHTDNPYRHPCPTLQLLHCIRNSAAGGASLLADGFAVAERLRTDNPDDFDLLAGHRVAFRFDDGESTDLRSLRPLIDVAPDGRIRSVAFNDRSIAPFDLDPIVLPDFYRAYMRFAEGLNDPAAAIEFTLGPGDAMVFDNERVLHGRTAYGDGARYLQGCYADKDALHSTIRVLERQLAT